MLIDKATTSVGAVFRSAIEEEFRALTKFGNELRIRHSEVGQEPVGDMAKRTICSCGSSHDLAHVEGNRTSLGSTERSSRRT